MIGSPPGTPGLTGSAACSLSKGFLLVEELCLFERAEVTCDTNGPISAEEGKSFQKEISKKVGDHVQILSTGLDKFVKLGENVCSVRYCIREEITTSVWLDIFWSPSVLNNFAIFIAFASSGRALRLLIKKAQQKTVK